jgi:5-methyltetrahydrofolate corrinoid/iron sulfur protein methyltransferase
MILIGERINAGFKEIKAAIINKDGDVIKQVARKQADAKATYIDVNLGTVSNKPEDLCWMIEMVQEEVDLPISIDNSKPAMIKEAIKVCKKPPLINSTTAEEKRLDELLPIAAEYQASIIGLVMDEAGSPKTVDKRVENAGKIFAKVLDYGLSPEQLFIDPIIMPLKYMQDQAKEILSAANQFQLLSDPPCHIVGGLSNISNGTKYKKLINRVFCAMLIANGLDAVILDVTDTELVDTILTAELVMNKSIYADSYLEAFRA